MSFLDLIKAYNNSLPICIQKLKHKMHSHLFLAQKAFIIVIAKNV